VRIRPNFGGIFACKCKIHDKIHADFIEFNFKDGIHYNLNFYRILNENLPVSQQSVFCGVAKASPQKGVKAPNRFRIFVFLIINLVRLVYKVIGLAPRQAFFILEVKWT